MILENQAVTLIDANAAVGSSFAGRLQAGTMPRESGVLVKKAGYLISTSFLVLQ